MIQVNKNGTIFKELYYDNLKIIEERDSEGQVQFLGIYKGNEDDLLYYQNQNNYFSHIKIT
jgi:hypothetical protein